MWNKSTLERKVAAIICKNLTAEKIFDDVRNYDAKGVLTVKIEGHILKIQVADLGEDSS